MEVRKQQVDAPSSPLLQVIAKLADPSPGVQYEDGAILERDLDAGRVPAVVDRLRPR
jgi:hypothetical protein